MKSYCRSEYRASGENKKGKTLQPWLLMSLDSQVFFVPPQKRKTSTRNMLCCAILFCTFPEIQGVGYRKNPVWEGRSAFSARGLEKPLSEIEGKRQGLSYFLSFFFSLHHLRKGLGRGALSSLECPSCHCWEGSNDKRSQDALLYCDRKGQLLMHLVPLGHRVMQKVSVCYLSICLLVHFHALTSCASQKITYFKHKTRQ